MKAADPMARTVNGQAEWLGKVREIMHQLIHNWKLWPVEASDSDDEYLAAVESVVGVEDLFPVNDACFLQGRIRWFLEFHRMVDL